MALTTAQYAQLQTEINTDPKSLGYAGLTDPPVATLLNQAGLSNETINVGIINGQELSKATVISEYVALSAAKRQGWTTILSAGDGQIDVDDQRVVDQIATIWSGATATQANLLALKTRPASRAEVLFGRDVRIGHLDIAKAR